MRIDYDRLSSFFAMLEQIPKVFMYQPKIADFVFMATFCTKLKKDFPRFGR